MYEICRATSIKDPGFLQLLSQFLIEAGRPMPDSAALERLEESGVTATIVVPSSLLKGNEELLFGAQAKGHALAMRAPASQILSTPPPALPAPYLDAIKAQQKTFKKSLGERPVIWSTDGLLTLAGELGVEQSRLTHVIVDSQDGVAHRVPRPDGTRGVALVMPASPIGCKGVVDPDYWHLDHATRILMQAPELRLPALRMRVRLGDLDAEGLELLGTWVDQVMLPAGVAFVTVDKITAEIPRSQAPKGPPPGRPISPAQLQAAAKALAAQPAPLPRSVGGFSLTELFLGLPPRLCRVHGEEGASGDLRRAPQGAAGEHALKPQDPGDRCASAGRRTRLGAQAAELHPELGGRWRPAAHGARAALVLGVGHLHSAQGRHRDPLPRSDQRPGPLRGGLGLGREHGPREVKLQLAPKR